MNSPTGRSRAVNVAIVALLICAAIAVAANYFYQVSLMPSYREARAEEPAETAKTAEMPTRRPDFTLPDIEGIKRTVSTWDGKVLVLNFWASWCAPCLEEIPAFVDLQRTYGEQGLQFVGIAVEKVEPVKAFLDKIPINYPILVHPSDTIPVAEAYGNEFGILPYTVIINREGNIAHTQIGAMSFDEAEEMIKGLL